MRRGTLLVLGVAAAIGAGAVAAFNWSGDAGTGGLPTVRNLLSCQQRPTALSCQSAVVDRRFVSPQGSDSNPGTRAKPWRTIEKALEMSKPGRAIYVRAGTYREWATLTKSGKSSALIVVRAFPGERPVLVGRLKITGSYFRISGLVFDGRTSSESGVLLYISGGDHGEIDHNEFRNAALSGIYLGEAENPSDQVQIVSNHVHDNGSHDNLDHGIYAGYARDGVIANNIIEHNHAQGIKLGPGAERILVTQNTIVANGRSGVMVSGSERWRSSDDLIVNNIVAYNADWGIRTFWQESPGHDNVAERNVVWGNDEDAFWFPGGGLSERGSIIDNPLFASLAERDYRLLAGSPAIDAALMAYTMRTDRRGVARDDAPSIGALER
jgi:parallel beta-helix repeat protein